MIVLHRKPKHILCGLMLGIGVCLCSPCSLKPALAAEDKPPVVAILTAGGLSIRKPVKTVKDFRQERAVMQRYDFSCGAAALATLLQHYYKLPVNEESIVGYLIRLRGPDKAVQRYKEKKGFSLLDLKAAAVSADFRCFAYRDMSLADLVELDEPTIVPVRTRQFDHFVLFRGLRGDRVYIVDPVAGNQTMKAANFVAVWHDGIGMVLKSNEGLKPVHWRPEESRGGSFVSQDVVRTITSSRGLGFVPKGPSEF